MDGDLLGLHREVNAIAWRQPQLGRGFGGDVRGESRRTVGLLVGAKAEIHRLVSQLAGQGVAVLMISSELPEVLGMSDRVMVMHEGRMTGIVDRKYADQVRIMELASQ